MPPPSLVRMLCVVQFRLDGEAPPVREPGHRLQHREEASWDARSARAKRQAEGTISKANKEEQARLKKIERKGDETKTRRKAAEEE